VKQPAATSWREVRPLLRCADGKWDGHLPVHKETLILRILGPKPTRIPNSRGPAPEVVGPLGWRRVL